MNVFKALSTSVLFSALALPALAQAADFETCTLDHVAGNTVFLQGCITDYQATHGHISYPRVAFTDYSWVEPVLLKAFDGVKEGTEVRVEIAGYNTPYGSGTGVLSLEIDSVVTKFEYGYTPYYNMVK